MTDKILIDRTVAEFATERRTSSPPARSLLFELPLNQG